MEQQELRRESRLRFEDPPVGEFSIVAAGSEVDVVAVHDLSHSGIRLHIGSPLGVATPVRVRYRVRRLHLQQEGIIRWQAPAEGGAMVVGIQLQLPAVPCGAQ